MARQRRMTELGRLLTAKLPTAILKLTWPCLWQNKYIIVGSVPVECCEPRKNGELGSKCFETEQDACRAIEAAGVTEYQLSDCSWVGR